MANPIQARINRMLKRANRKEQLRRHPSGYYYVTDVAVSSALYTYRLTWNRDFDYAKEHVEDVLSREDRKPFKFPVEREIVGI